MPRISVHPLLFLFAGGAYLLGVYREFLLLFLALVFHEAFHAAAALALGYRILSLELLPYGGRVSLEAKGYGRIASEIGVLFADPASHALFLALPWPWTEALLGHYASWWRDVHASLLAFNLLPVFPLDGGRIVLAALAAWLPYRRAVYAAYGVGVGLVLAGIAWALLGIRTPSLGLSLYAPFLLWWNVRELRLTEEEFLHFLWRRYRFLSEVRSFPPFFLGFSSSDAPPLAVLRHARRERYLRLPSSSCRPPIFSGRSAKDRSARSAASGERSLLSEAGGPFPETSKGEGAATAPLFPDEEGFFLTRLFSWGERQ